MRHSQPRISYVVGGTAAASFHVSDTVDWSSLSAQAKNRVTLVKPRLSAPNVIISPAVSGEGAAGSSNTTYRPK